MKHLTRRNKTLLIAAGLALGLALSIPPLNGQEDDKVWGAFTAWMLVPQFAFAALGAVITGGVTVLSRRFRLVESAPVRKLLIIMGNMVALPQVVLLFAMLDIFLYNAYQIRLIPIWAFALIVMAGGGAVLGVLLIQALRQSQKTPGKTLQE